MTTLPTGSSRRGRWPRYGTGLRRGVWSWPGGFPGPRRGRGADKEVALLLRRCACLRLAGRAAGPRVGSPERRRCARPARYGAAFAETSRYGGATARLVEIYNNGFFVEDSGSYTVGDHLGSASLVLSRSGAIADEFSFDAWGQPRNPGTWQNLPLFSAWPDYPADQGFGGHRMLGGTGLVHMGGRLYDPGTGRFLSADPFVQEPNNLQNYNRYTYVLNNPLSYVDPSGYIFKKIGRALGKVWKAVRPYIGTVITVALTMVGVPAPVAGLIGGAVGAAANGATAGAFLKGMAIGSVAGMIAVPIADGAAAWMGFAADTLGHAVAHGTVVGALSSAMTAAVYGQDIWKAMRTGALLGGGTAAVVHLYGPKGRLSGNGSNGEPAEARPLPDGANAVIAVGDVSRQPRYAIGRWVHRVFGLPDIDPTSAVDAAKLQLEGLGFTVHVDMQATVESLMGYLMSPDLEAFMFIGHGVGDGGVSAIQGVNGWIRVDQFVRVTASGEIAIVNGGNLRIGSMIACGSANPNVGGRSWADVLAPGGDSSRLWFHGYTDPQQSVSSALRDVRRGRALPNE